MDRLLAPISTHWLALCSLMLVAITVLSLWPADQLPDVPGADKTHHFIAYGALMFPAALRKPKQWLFIALFFLGWSGGIELIQPYVNRYGEWLDMLANLGGIVCGIIIASVLSFFVIDK